MKLAPWPIHLIDARGQPHSPNSAFAAAVGYEVDDFDKITFRRCIPSRSRRQFAEIRRTLQDTDQPPYAELTLTYHHRDGTELTARNARIGPVDDPDTSAAVMIPDLKPPAKLERFDVQSRFAGLVVHDLNNAFTIAQSYVDLARRQNPPARLSADYLERAARAIQRGIQLADHLQIIADPRHLPTEDTDVQDVLADLRPFISRLLSPGPPWSVFCQQELPTVRTHRVRLSRFLLDFCLNAQLRWPHSQELTLEVRSSTHSHPAVLMRIKPPEHTASALSTSYRPVLSRPRRTSSQASVSPLFLYGILDRHPISLDLADDALTALLPGVEQ